MERKRKYARYPLAFGDLYCDGVTLIAERNGMEVIQCYKPPMNCWIHIGVFGTHEQMNRTEAEWASHGNTPSHKNSRSVFGVNLKRPREQWASSQKVRQKCKKALLELARSETGIFKGAIGRLGTMLVKNGFAKRIGVTTYYGGSCGEKATRYVEFEFTKKGERAYALICEESEANNG